MTIYFIDFENIQEIPEFKKVNTEDKIILFVGVHQKTLKIEFVEKLLQINNIEIIKIEKQGKNNLDFHLCYHLGIQAHCNEKKVDFVVVSNDKYFDPIVATINKQGRKCKRISKTQKTEIKEKNLKNTNKIPNEFSLFLDNLKAKQKKNRPRKIKTLLNALNAFTKKQYDEKTIDIFIKLGIIETDNSKIIYKI